MKIFLYKTLIIAGVFLIVFQFSIGSITRKINKTIINMQSKENVERVKEKIRNEIKVSLKKDQILNEEDKILIIQFINKIKNEISN